MKGEWITSPINLTSGMNNLNCQTSPHTAYQAGASTFPVAQRYYVKQLILQRGVNNGERISLLVDRITGVPVTLPNEHMLVGQRLLLKPNTYFSRLYGISLLYKWAHQNGISIAERLLGGIGFPDHEVASVFSTVRTRRRQAGNGRLIVSRTEQRRRMISIRDFVVHGMQMAANRLNPLTDAEKLNALQNRIDTTRVLFDQYKPKEDRRPMKKGLTEERVERLLKVISPASSENPWKGAPVRHRNFILILLFLVTGCRRGDLAKVKISDVVASTKPFIRFDADIYDPKDRRVAEPSLKTQPREYPVHLEIANAVARYIDEHRSAIPNASLSEYLFLATNNGTELALRTINDIFETLQNVVPDVTPHILRHTRTEALLHSATSRGLTDEEVLASVMYLNGWRTDNLATYTARRREEEAHTIALALQEEFLSK